MTKCASPFGIQRVPRRAGGSPFQQPTIPVTPTPTTPPPARCCTGTTCDTAQAQVRASHAPTSPAPASPAPAPGADSSQSVGFACANCDLLEFIRNVGTELKLNYVIDPKVKGVVTIHTYGDLKQEDLLPVLETVLRINGAAMVKTGNFYQIVLAAGARQLPLEIRKPGKEGSNFQRLMPKSCKLCRCGSWERQIWSRLSSPIFLKVGTWLITRKETSCSLQKIAPIWEIA